MTSARLSADSSLRLAAASGIAVALGAALNASPGLAALDAGDFVTAAASLGVPHATGFPLFTALNSLAMQLPLGNLANRAATVSALLSGLASFSFSLGISRLFPRLRLALTAACTLAFFCVPTLSLHARVPEVYALNLALAGGIFALLCAATARAADDSTMEEAAGANTEAQKKARALFGVALLLAFGLTNHALWALFAPLVIISAIAAANAQTRRALLPAALAIGAATGLAYGLLPASALRSPEHNWGDPSTPAQFFQHLSGHEIRVAFAAEMKPTLESMAFHGRTLWSQLQVLPAWLTPALLYGVALLLRSSAGRLLVTFSLVDLFYSVCLNPMGLRDFQNGQMLGFSVFLATMLGFCSALRALLETFIKRLGARDFFSEKSAAVAGILLAIPSIGSPMSNLADDWAIDDLAFMTHALAQPNAAVFPISDNLTSSLLYSDIALDARPDVATLGRGQLGNGRAANFVLGKQPFELADPETSAAWQQEGFGNSDARAARVLVYLFAQSQGWRPVYWEGTGTGDALPTTFSLEHRWPMGRVISSQFPNATSGGECEPEEFSYCNASPESAFDVSFAQSARVDSGATGFWYNRWLASVWGYRGARAFKSGDMLTAGRSFQTASAIDGTNSAWFTGLALALANAGRIEEAIEVQRRALALNPLSAVARRNLAGMEAARNPAH